MKVLVVSHACATPVNQRLFAGLRELTGWELDLIIPAGWRDEFGNRLDAPPIPGLAAHLRKIPVWGNGNIILHGYRTNWRTLLGNACYDAIYLHQEPYAISALQVCRANSRLPEPAVLGFYSAQNILKNYPPPFRWFERLVYRSSGFALPVSREVESVLRRKGFGAISAVCPLPVDLRLYQPRPQAECERLLPRAGGEVVLGYVGRLVEAKGLRTLACALGRIRDLRWRLVVIGTGAFRGEFETQLEQEGVRDRVEMHGYIDHEKTPAYLAAMDTVVVPSETQPNWKEQFGRIVVEAMACGTMVIGSSSGEIPSLLNASGGGMVFAERDVGALAARLREAITNETMRNSSARSGADWVNRTMSAGVVARCMAETIEAAVAKRILPTAQ